MQIRYIVLAVLTTWMIIFGSSVLLHGNKATIFNAPPPPPPKRIVRSTITQISKPLIIEDPEPVEDLEVVEDGATHEGEL